MDEGLDELLDAGVFAYEEQLGVLEAEDVGLVSRPYRDLDGARERLV